MSRRDRIRAETTAEIKRIAREQMREVGAASISLRGIARSVGMSAPSIYNYFPNYDALITALIVDAFNGMADAVEAAVSRCAPSDFSGQFVAYTQAYRQWAKDNPENFFLICGTPIPDYQAPTDITSPAALRGWRALFSILVQAYFADQLTVPEEFERSTPAYKQMQKMWREDSGLDVPVPVLHIGVAGASLCNGLLLAELSNRFFGVMEETFQIELDEFRSRIGLTNSP